MSGTSEALVYDGLAAVGSAGAYLRVHGWMTSAELLVQVPTAFLASGLFALGGYPLVGWVSVGCCLAAGLLALRFPEAPRTTDDEDGGSLRSGVRRGAPASGRAAPRAGRRAHRWPGRRRGVLPGARRRAGRAETAVPVAILVIALAGAAGAALGGRADRLPRASLLLPARRRGRCSLAGGGPAGPGRAAIGRRRRCSTRSTSRSSSWPRRGCRTGSPARHRATITSVAGLGIELASLLVFAAWAVGGPVAVAVLVVAVVPVVRAGLRTRSPV